MKRLCALFLCFVMISVNVFASEAEDRVVIETIKSASESVVAIVGNYKSDYLSTDAQDYNELYAHGAGVVIKENGTILTNAHVVEDIENLTVIFGDGDTYSGAVQYIDKTSDLAVVRINKTNLKPVKFAEENSLEVGQSVIAIGTPLSVSLINSASKGIVSGIGVNINQHYLFTQSDVAINGGNSGGPLINLKGELVGINSIKYVGSDVEGMSFSIPVDTINYVLSSFEKYGKVVRPETGITFTESWESQIGVPTKKGLTVSASENDSLLPGDMVTHVNGFEVHSIADYNEAIKKSFNGGSIEFTYIRKSEVNTVDVEAEADFTREDDGSVEIILKAGEENILINGVGVVSQAPYIIEGTTMVPVRVITEAFGAEVSWVNETKEIILTYKDEKIVLAIGSKVVICGDETKDIPVAPYLSGGVTMVPVRFISEYFGSEVNYNGETGEISVIKEKDIEGNTISSSTDLPKIGDSYWKWSMLTPSSMMMQDRDMAGEETYFSNEECFLYISITSYIKDEDYKEEKVFENSYEYTKKSEMSRMTLSKDEKGTDEHGNKCYRLTGRSKTDYMDVYGVLKDKVMYEVGFSCNVESERMKAYIGILESFKPYFGESEEEKEEIYDLSNVDENGDRMIENEEMKISFKASADFYEAYSYSRMLNEVEYINDDEDCVKVVVYTKTDDVTASNLAEKDRQLHYDYMNKALCAVSEVGNYEADFAENIYYYSVTPFDKDGEYKQEFYDVFFDVGDYVYNLAIFTQEDEGKLFEKVMGSFEAEELDSEEMGYFIYDAIDFSPWEIKEDKWSITMDKSWVEGGVTDEYGVYKNKFTGASLSFAITDLAESGYSGARSAAMAAMEISMDGYEVEITKPLFQKTLGGRIYYGFAIRVTYEDYYGDEVVDYSTGYITQIGKKLCMFELSEEEEYVNSKTAEDVEKFIGTFTLN